jgi:hypothetical protein
MTRTSSNLAAALAAIATAAMLTACGSSSPSKPHSAGADDQKVAICMRAHGVPNFPDLGTTASYHYMAEVNQSAPAFESAQKACAKYGDPMAPPAPPSESQMRELVKFSQCMRTHGVPNFPDPTGNNVETEQLIARLGIDPRSPAFQQAAAACGDPGLWDNGVP